MTLFGPADPRPVHFMGIGGAGMSALATVAKRRGVRVTGCDTDPSGAADLAALGVEVWQGHDPQHLDGVRAVVVTAAVGQDHPELKRARALGVPVVRRADAPRPGPGGGTAGALAGAARQTTTPRGGSGGRAGAPRGAPRDARRAPAPAW